MISVIVCTCNRSHKLQQALHSLAEMAIPDKLQWELLIVDNNSKDNTAALAQEFAESSAFEVRYVFEAQPGLCRARNRGVREARGEILAFTDDDCLAEAHWLEAIFAAFANDPELAMLGGSFFNYSPADQALRKRIIAERATLTSAKHAFRLIAGGNMAFRREVFDQVGPFDPHLDVGTRFKSAGDSDFAYRAFKAGYKIVHAPEVIIHHHHGRKTEAQVLSLKRGYVLGRGAVYGKHILRGDWVICKLACREIFRHNKRLVINLTTGKPIARQRYRIGELVRGIAAKIACELHTKCKRASSAGRMPALQNLQRETTHVPTGESHRR